MSESFDLDDHFHDKCGIFGIWNANEASKLICLGLQALQHRGEESAGITTIDNCDLYTHKSLGLVKDIFNAPILNNLKGTNGIGHVRYSTSGDNNINNAQPLINNNIAIAHNGNITNALMLRKELESEGFAFETTSDTEVILHLLQKYNSLSIQDRISKTLTKLKGAFSLVILTTNELIVVRDSFGFRPLVLGKLNDSGSHVVSSETTGLDLINASYVRDINPGEVLLIDHNGMNSIYPFKSITPKMCVFEYIYFARPDSSLNNISVYDSRKNFGKLLAKETHIDADVVIPVPDSGTPAALGYSEESEIPFDLGLIRSHYTGRTFIEPEVSIRNLKVKLKLNPNKLVINNKRIIVVDDSIVRGTTSKNIVKMLRDAGAKEIHLRISSPPVKWPCYYGIDTPLRKDLVSSYMTNKQIADFVGADTVEFLSLDAVYEAVKGKNYCTACFTGNYPEQYT